MERRVAAFWSAQRMILWYIGGNFGVGRADSRSMTQGRFAYIKFIERRATSGYP